MTRQVLNAYWCPKCHGYIVTEDIDRGVTPMFLACRVKGEPDSPENDCDGTMQSMMYPDPPWPAEDGYGHAIPTTPTWEWYAPGRTALKAMKRRDLATYDHVRKGGLLLRQKA